ncbi:hypothetical protein L204_100033 [Cryptococcus depauperatus]|nr:hypothetical protein L204_02486 [Cryptococcus depauperatus CBS 7855]
MAPVKHPSQWPPPYSALAQSTKDHVHITKRVYVTATISENTPKSTPSSSGILAEAVATTHLSWWQLLAIILGSVLALAVGIWLWWRHRKKVKVDEAKKKAEIEEREQKRVEDEKEKKLMGKKRAMRGKKGRGRSKREESETDSDEYWSDSDSESESDDSISDGGTIHPSRTRRRRVKRRGNRRKRDRGRYGNRRRRSETESETDYSDESYYPRRNRRGRRRSSYDSYYDRRPSRRVESPLSPSPPVPAAAKKQSKGFRDSVFSSYNSMKNAAVRLKYVEAKVKLKKQLDDEEKLEQIRREKIREANKEIEDAKKWENERNNELLIPPVARRPTTKHSTSTLNSLPTPRQRDRNRQTAYRGGSLDTIQRPQQSHQGDGRRQLYPPKHATVDTVRPQPQRNKTGDSLGNEITQLLGNGSGTRNNLREPTHPTLQDRAGTRQQPSFRKYSRSPSNNVQESWLPHPSQHGPGRSSPPEKPNVPETARSDSVYLSVTHPKDRPKIPRGGLAPAPPGKNKNLSNIADKPINGGGSLNVGPSWGSNNGTGAFTRPPEKAATGGSIGVGVGGNVAGIGAGSSKWANRLRERMK